MHIFCKSTFFCTNVLRVMMLREENAKDISSYSEHTAAWLHHVQTGKRMSLRAVFS